MTITLSRAAHISQKSRFFERNRMLRNHDFCNALAIGRLVGCSKRIAVFVLSSGANGLNGLGFNKTPRAAMRKFLSFVILALALAGGVAAISTLTAKPAVAGCDGNNC
jgi:hypothetical protein